MNYQSILANPRFKNLLIALGIIALAYIILNAFIIGGEQFLFTLNQNFYTPFAFVTALLAVRLWSKTKEGRNRALFSGLSIGWVCWFAAELTWGVYTILGREVPYPSIADAFWIFGYIPIIIGLYLRLREIPIKLTQDQSTALWGTTILIALVTFFFILLPIIIDYDPDNLIESILNITYPLVDIILMVVILQLLFAYQKGNYGIAWLILAVGFTLMSISDLIFAYTSSVDLYYPELYPNFISRFGVDVPYALSYMTWSAGLYALLILFDQPAAHKGVADLRPVPNTHLIIHTKSDNTIIQTSANFEKYFGIKGIGLSLERAINVPQQDAGKIHQAIRANARVSDLPIHIRDYSGNQANAYLCSLAILESENQFQGANICLRLVTGGESLDSLLRDESKSVLTFILKSTGVQEEEEIKKLLLDYYLIQFQALHDLVHDLAGPAAGRSFWDGLQNRAADLGSNISFDGPSLETSASLPALRKNLPLILDQAKRFTGQYGEMYEVDVRLNDVHSQLGDDVKENLRYHMKAV